MQTMEFRARCPHCNTERVLIGPWPATNPAELDLIEASLTKRVSANCPGCGRVEQVAMFVDGSRAEPWQDADEMERQHGASAGPLPPKLWPDTN